MVNIPYTVYLDYIFSQCQCCDMKLNPANNNSIIFSCSTTANSPHPDIIIGNQVIHSCNFLKLLQVTLDSKLTFENHIRKTASLISQKAGLLRKCRAIFKLFKKNLIIKLFFELCFPLFPLLSTEIRMSAVASLLKIFDGSFNLIRFLFII